jgi:membrane protein YdbS with pleckstrin-like domain
MNCSQCGAPVPAGSRFCPKCGQQLAGPVAPPVSIPAPPGATDNFAAGPIGRRRIVDVPEEVLWENGISARSMFGTWLTAGVASLIGLAGAGYLYSTARQLPAWIVLAAVAGLWLLLGLNFALARLGVHYKLTNQRFFFQHGILRRVVDRIEVIEIEDLAYEQGLLDRVLGTGKIKIISGDRTNPVLWLNGIDNVQEVFAMIDRARRAERMRRSVSIETIGGAEMGTAGIGGGN